MCARLPHMLTYADVCWRMLTYADGRGVLCARGCHVCWRMLTYADVCWRMLMRIGVLRARGCHRDSGPPYPAQSCSRHARAPPHARAGDVCCRMLCWRMLCWRMLNPAHVMLECRRMPLQVLPALTYADVCCAGVLTYADVCPRSGACSCRCSLRSSLATRISARPAGLVYV
jgi:hypothetical protein